MPSLGCGLLPCSEQNERHQKTAYSVCGGEQEVWWFYKMASQTSLKFYLLISAGSLPYHGNHSRPVMAQKNRI